MNTLSKMYLLHAIGSARIILIALGSRILTIRIPVLHIVVIIVIARR